MPRRRFDGSLRTCRGCRRCRIRSPRRCGASAEINPQTAGRLGIGDGDVVEIGSAHGTVRAPALHSPGIAPDVLAMPVGQGHETFTRYASGRGSNPVKVLGPSVEQETGALAWAATRVKITRVAGPDGGLIRFGASLTEAAHTHR
jgi:predicted molibdopterin-dependent oxidoreductase YjgC